MGSAVQASYRLRRISDGQLIADNVTVASSFWGRLRGLMGRAGLGEDEGLYLGGTNGVHMLFMRFPIDCLFLGRRGEDGSQPVVAVRHSLPPWRGVVWYVRGARAVVELPAGTLTGASVRVGDVVSFEPPA